MEPASLQFKDNDDESATGASKYRTDGLTDDDSDNSDGFIVNDGEVSAHKTGCCGAR